MGAFANCAAEKLEPAGMPAPGIQMRHNELEACGRREEGRCSPFAVRCSLFVGSTSAVKCQRVLGHQPEIDPPALYAIPEAWWPGDAALAHAVAADIEKQALRRRAALRQEKQLIRAPRPDAWCPEPDA